MTKLPEHFNILEIVEENTASAIAICDSLEIARELLKTHAHPDKRYVITKVTPMEYYLGTMREN